MSKRKFALSIVLLVITIPILCIYLTFSNSFDCNQLVIDTYELHSKINIPEVDFVNCYYDEELNTRISVYDLKDKIDLNQFQLVSSPFEEHLRGSNLMTNEEHPAESNLYLSSGVRWGTKWTYMVDHKSNRLWAELNY